MIALILLDNDTLLNPNVAQVRRASNACQTMGIDVQYYLMYGQPKSEVEDVIKDAQIDFIVRCAASSNSGNRAAHDTIKTGLSVPMFSIGTSDVNASITQGITGKFGSDLFSTIAHGQLDGRGIMSVNVRFVLSTETLPAQSIAIATGLSANGEEDAAIAWKYANGTDNWIYYCNVGANSNMLHALVQTAINDGVLSKPPQKAPIIVSIDHINQGNDGSDYGVVSQPEQINTIGEILRSVGGVCYASLEQSSFSNGNLLSATLEANLVTNSDVFRFIACHDHSGNQLSNTGYTTSQSVANSALENQETKIAIDGSYQATKSLIEGIGLTVSTNFGHFAGNQVGTNFWDLAQSGVSVMADPLETTPKAGYGFLAARMGGRKDNAQSYPATSADEQTWLAKETYYNGIRITCSSTDGDIQNGDLVDLGKDWDCFKNNMQALVMNTVYYHHMRSFEDPVDGFISSGDEFGRGKLAWNFGADYAKYCVDTVQFGADIEDYL